MKIGEVEIFEEKCLDAVDWPKNQALSEKLKLEKSYQGNFRGEMCWRIWPGKQAPMKKK